MKKINPFYHYLLKHHRSSVQCKTDSYDQAFLFFPLEEPASCFTFDYHESELKFIEHHITVYAELDDDAGFKSAFHYTIKFETHTVHVYFDEHIECITATIEQNDTHKITILKHLFDELNDELISIKIIFEQNAQPIVQSWHAQHMSSLHDLETQYTTALEDLKNHLFDVSEDVVGNIRLIQKNIKLAEQLSLVSYKQNFVRNTMSYLTQCLSKYKEAQLIVPHQTAPKKAAKISAAIDEEPITTSFSSTKTSKPVQRKQSTARKKQTLQKEIEDFQTSYGNYLRHWDEYVGCRDLSTRLELFKPLGMLIATLQGASLVLQDVTLAKDSLRRQVELDVQLFQETYQKTGIILLLECLKLPELLSQHEETLKQFVPQLSVVHIETMIRQQNTNAVVFLLKHGTFNVNQHLMKFKKGPAMSLLCAAYQLNNIKLFELLLKNNASSLALYEDMPLAHTLLHLPADNPFYKALLLYCKPVLDANPRFYKTLCAAVTRKLRDDQLDSTQIAALNQVYADYQQKSQANHGEICHLSSNVRCSVASLREGLAIGGVSTISTSPEFTALQEELAEKSAELFKLLRQRHQDKAFARVSEQYYKCAQNLLESNPITLLQMPTEEQILDVLRDRISLVQANIDVLTLQMKPHLSKNERKRYHNAILLLERQQQVEDLKQRQVDTSTKIRKMGFDMLSSGLKMLKDPMASDVFGDNASELSKAFKSMGKFLRPLKQKPVENRPDILESLTELTSGLSMLAETLKSDWPMLDVTPAPKSHMIEDPNAPTGDALTACGSTLFHERAKEQDMNLLNEEKRAFNLG